MFKIHSFRFKSLKGLDCSRVKFFTWENFQGPGSQRQVQNVQAEGSNWVQIFKLLKVQRVLGSNSWRGRVGGT